MSDKTYRVVGIGNAIVDVLTQCDDSFLDLMGIQKGIMQLVERERGEMLYGAMTERRQAAGGSVANTLAGLGNLGLETGFIGRVADDALGQFYAKSMNEGGTDFVNAPVASADLPTSRSMIFVSGDGERSMNTYLGISADLGPDDVTDATNRRGKPRSSVRLRSAARQAGRRASPCPIPSAPRATARISSAWWGSWITSSAMVTNGPRFMTAIWKPR